MSTEKPKGFWKQLAQVIKDEFETSAIGFEVNSHIANAKMSNERRQEGRDARSASLQMDNNPYTDKTDRKDWDQGWNEEDQRLVAEKLLEEKIAVEKKANEQQICRDQGGAARALSQPRKSNPFKDSDANAAWNAGWDEEHEKACRNEGSEARKQGIARSENPHFDHVSNSAWEKGWSASHLSCSITEGQQARLSGIPESSNPHSDPVGNPGWLKGWKKEAKTSILRSQAEGVKARSSGLSIECNPYSIHDDRVSWERGWEEENKARLNAEVVVRKQRNLENGGCINCGGKLTNGMPCFACGTSWAVNRLEAEEWRKSPRPGPDPPRSPCKRLKSRRNQPYSRSPAATLKFWNPHRLTYA
jgi:ribosome modulation factor